MCIRRPDGLKTRDDERERGGESGDSGDNAGGDGLENERRPFVVPDSLLASVAAPLLWLGAIRLLQGDRDAAERLLLRATELDPFTADPWLTLAFLYDQAGETEKAQAATSRAAELSR